MIDVLTNLLTARFWVGVFVGAVGQRLTCWIWHRYQDRRHPLPNGRRRHLAGINRVWVVGAAVIFVLGYQLYESQRLAKCQRQFGDAVEYRSTINAQNDRLSLAQRELLASNQRAEAEWITGLIHPSDPAIAALSYNDPQRERWAVSMTVGYFTKADGINGRIAAISDEQCRLDEHRSRTEIPDPTCGRG